MARFKIELEKLEERLLDIEKFLHDADEKSKYKIMFISEELLTNIARHADFEDKEPFVTFDINISKEGTFMLQCKDNAKAFNPLQREDPNINLTLQEKEFGGLGIFLTKKYAQTIKYSYDDGFNIVSIQI